MNAQNTAQAQTDGLVTKTDGKTGKTTTLQTMLFFNLVERETDKKDILGNAKKQMYALCNDGKERKAYAGFGDTVKVDTSDVNALHGITNKTTIGKPIDIGNGFGFMVNFTTQPKPKKQNYYISVKGDERPNTEHAKQAIELLQEYASVHLQELASDLDAIADAIADAYNKVKTVEKANDLATFRLMLAKSGLTLQDLA
jgi:hypothetical protein